MSFEIPIVVIIFNRPDLAKMIFLEIKKIKPRELFVISDGPRESSSNDKDLVLKSRHIYENIDWDCNLHKNYSNINLGCKIRLSSGLDWVFSNVKSAIILEDDCLPSQSFFFYCKDLLNKYSENKMIGMIGGVNFCDEGLINSDESYYFTKYSLIWGWATWADRWHKYYDVNISLWPKIRKSKHFHSLLLNSNERVFWNKIFDKVYNGKIDTWDYQWTFANFMNNRLVILPKVNLISNIGFRSDATHTNGFSKLSNNHLYDLKFPLSHPKLICVNLQRELSIYDKCFRIKIFNKLINKIFGLIINKFKSLN